MGICSNKLKDELQQEIDICQFSNISATYSYSHRAQHEIYCKDVRPFLMDFKYIMAENAYAIQAARRRNPESQQLVDSPFSASPIVDRVWELALLFTKNYEAVSIKTCGQYIKRPQPNPKTVPKDAIEEFYDLSLLEYENKNTIWIKKKQLWSILKNRQLIANLQGQVDTFKVVQQLRDQISKMASFNLGERENHFKNEQVQQVYVQIYDMIRDQLYQRIQDRYCLDEQNAEEYIKEYARFLTMMKFSKVMCTPSEEVDQIWHTHIGMTDSYMQMCQQIYGQYKHHSPTEGLGEQDKFRSIYQRTLNLYEELFLEKAQPDLWPDVETRFNNQQQEGCWISLFRLVMTAIRISEYDIENITDCELLQAYLVFYSEWKGHSKKDVNNINFKSKDFVNVKSGKDAMWSNDKKACGCGAGCGAGCG